jgi:hypothetical protein
MAIGLLATMWCMVSNATYIMVVILLVEETGEHGQSSDPSQVTDKFIT